MNYKYKDFKGCIGVNEDGAYDITIYDETGKYQVGFYIPLRHTRHLNFIINKIKKEVNIIMKQRASKLIKEISNHIEL